MSCKHLYCYTPASRQWSVASCSCKTTPYVPSMQELEACCKTTRHALCPFFLLSMAIGSPRTVRSGAMGEAR